MMAPIRTSLLLMTMLPALLVPEGVKLCWCLSFGPPAASVAAEASAPQRACCAHKDRSPQKTSTCRCCTRAPVGNEPGYSSGQRCEHCVTISTPPRGTSRLVKPAAPVGLDAIDFVPLPALVALPTIPSPFALPAVPRDQRPPPPPSPRPLRI